MVKVSWAAQLAKYSSGVDRGVIYLPYTAGVPFSGLTRVDVSPSDSEEFSGYYDGRKYRNLVLEASLTGTIESIAPIELMLLDAGPTAYLTLQGRTPLNLCYRTMTGKSTYEIHILYNVLLGPESTDHKSMVNAPDVSSVSRSFATKPIDIPGAKYGCHIVVDSKTTHPWTLEELENTLYGTDDTEATLPTPSEIIEMFEAGAILRITDHGDGTWTAEGPDEAIEMVSADEFAITWPSAIPTSTTTYKISSL